MTCIVTYKNKKGTKSWMGADRQTMSGDMTSYQHKKIMGFETPFGRMLIGLSGRSVYRSCLVNRFTMPQNSDNKDLNLWLKNEFVDAIKKTYFDFGCLAKDGDEIEVWNGKGLILCQNRIFIFFTDFMIVEYTNEPFYAVGVSIEAALASLQSTFHLKMKPKEKIKEALRVSRNLYPTISKEIDIEKL